MSMYGLGIDAGTTSVSVVVVDVETGDVVESVTRPNDVTLKSGDGTHCQDAERIWQIADEIARQMLASHPGVRCVGLTGQMHGILYADAEGKAVSPLYTWQDGRGDKLR